jgi:hypothetical protein
MPLVQTRPSTVHHQDPDPTVAQAEFTAEPRSVSLARAFVRRELHARGADRYGEDAALVVSELATNAVTRARAPFVVRLLLRPGHARVEVSDPDESGRGLLVVAAVARSWGVGTAGGSDPLIWAEVGPGSRSRTRMARSG